MDAGWVGCYRATPNFLPGLLGRERKPGGWPVPSHLLSCAWLSLFSWKGLLDTTGPPCPSPTWSIEGPLLAEWEGQSTYLCFQKNFYLIMKSVHWIWWKPKLQGLKKKKKCRIACTT